MITQRIRCRYCKCVRHYDFDRMSPRAKFWMVRGLGNIQNYIQPMVEKNRSNYVVYNRPQKTIIPSTHFCFFGSVLYWTCFEIHQREERLNELIPWHTKRQNVTVGHFIRDKDWVISSYIGNSYYIELQAVLKSSFLAPGQVYLLFTFLSMRPTIDTKQR